MIKILSVAGYDGSGGAGITSDSKIFSSLGIYGLSATSALTAQNPQSIHEVLPIPDKFFEKELKAVFEYFNIDAVKTGIISGTRQAEILARLIKKYKARILVVDPVFISTSNKKLTGGIDSYPELLFPLFARATVITPNIKEAGLISGIGIKDEESMRAAAYAIRRLFPGIGNIVIKGSHLEGGIYKDRIFNILLDSKNHIYSINGKRIITKRELHGTGCAFSGALVSFLAMGLSEREAVRAADKMVKKFIRNSGKIPDNSGDKKIHIIGNI